LRGKATDGGATDADVDAAIAAGRAKLSGLSDTAQAILDRLKAEGKIA